MKAIIALFAVMGFVSVANANEHKAPETHAAPAAAEHAAAPEAHADHAEKKVEKKAKKHAKKAKKAEKVEGEQKAEAPVEHKAEAHH